MSWSKSSTMASSLTRASSVAPPNCLRTSSMVHVPMVVELTVVGEGDISGELVTKARHRHGPHPGCREVGDDLRMPVVAIADRETALLDHPLQIALERIADR
jgi:hypothetical protein